MLRRLVSKYSFSARHISSPQTNKNLLSKFGITEPSIYRNLTYPIFLNRVSEYYEFGLSNVPHEAEVKPNI